jgi:hypothetical protein
MSTMAYRQTPEPAMNPRSRQSHPQQGLAESGGSVSSSTPARLQVIHHLVRSGDYHVPAIAIADRMIEHLMIAKQESES